jgi:uncharacterized protein (TIGR02246 family)
MSERVKNIDVASIYDLWREYAKTVNDGDLDRWIALWTEDGIQMLPNNPTRFGKDQIRETMQLHLDHYSISKMVINTREIQVLGDRAYSHGTYTYEITPRANGEPTRFFAKFLDILAKQIDGTWKIAIDCHNFSETGES